MNKYNVEKMNSMSNTEVKRFASLLYGLESFMHNEKCIRLSKKKFSQKYNQKELARLSFGFRYQVISEEREDKFYLYDTRKRAMTIAYADEMETIKTIPLSKYETNEFNDIIIGILLDVAHDKVSGEEGYKKIDFLKELENRNIEYRFVLGCGISCDYDIASWSKFEDNLKKIVNLKFSYIPKGDEKYLSDSISSDVFNANYGTFQIVKQLFYDDYKNELLSLSKWNEKKILEKTSLYYISKILHYQGLANPNLNQNVITFNYDDILETISFHNFGEECVSETKKNSKKTYKPPFKVTVVHTHGFIPHDLKTTKDLEFYMSNLVVTTDDYYKAYNSPGVYSYKKLNKQLDNTCYFVGNSITDYEEQKVIGTHFLNNPADFHFALLSKQGKNIYQIMYKTVFLINIGIIPLWFNSFEEIKEDLKKKADEFIDATIF